MSKHYKVNFKTRIINSVMTFMINARIGPHYMYILSVRGRKSGKIYSMPVSLVEEIGKRWLVAPYGEVNWVKNARAAGEVLIARGGEEERMSIHAIDPQEAAPILKTYINREPIPRPYFNVTPDAPIEAFIKEAPQHPVFLLTPKQSK